MFTGIVQAVGTVVRLDPLEVECGALDLGDVRVGDSICVHGACLTVTALTGRGFTADVSAETRRLTAGVDRIGGRVNLEKSLAVGDRLGGHLVTGHVDGVGEVLAFREGVLRVRMAHTLLRYVARKGSICVDGVSLTVNAVDADAFEAFLIPHTCAATTLGSLAAGSRVNLEVDLVARYVESLLGRS